MKKNKKGKIGLYFAIVVVVVVLVSLIPIVVDSIDRADSQILECNDGTNTILNETLSPSLCCNQTNCAGNSTPTEAGLTPGQEAIALLSLTFLMLGVVTLVAKKVGLM